MLKFFIDFLIIIIRKLFLDFMIIIVVITTQVVDDMHSCSQIACIIIIL